MGDLNIKIVNCCFAAEAFLKCLSQVRELFYEGLSGFTFVNDYKFSHCAAPIHLADQQGFQLYAAPNLALPVLECVDFVL